MKKALLLRSGSRGKWKKKNNKNELVGEREIDTAGYTLNQNRKSIKTLFNKQARIL
jgi:hypothetical protein